MSKIKKAAEDLKYLLDRDYNKRTALNLVVNHYKSSDSERNYLQRYVFSDRDIELHMSRLYPIEKIAMGDVIIDGYNVLVTVEAILGGKELVKGMDGFLRDNSAIFSRYIFDKNTKKALKKTVLTLKEYMPRSVLFLFDSQMSHSGELASYVRCKLNELGLSGDARTSRIVDKEIVDMNGITVTTDSIIIEKVDRVVDIGSAIYERLES
jgi:hypothetical protein